MPSHIEHDQNNTHQQPPVYVSSYAAQNMACNMTANPESHSQCPEASLGHFPAVYCQYGGGLKNRKICCLYLHQCYHNSPQTSNPKSPNKVPIVRLLYDPVAPEQNKQCYMRWDYHH